VVAHPAPPTASKNGVKLTNFASLLSFAAAQIWKRSVSGVQSYGPALLTDLPAFRKTLVGPYGRGTVGRLIELAECYSCGVPVPFKASSDGDHIIPKADGGPLGYENFAPMCVKCNSRKGSLDLMHWWAKRNKTLWDLNNDVLLQYSRQKFVQLVHRGLLEDPASAPVEFLLGQFATTLPTLAHTDAFNAIPARAELVGVS
jgi:5-methylcytosine-specific restriction endonuclease McrA